MTMPVETGAALSERARRPWLVAALGLAVVALIVVVAANRTRPDTERPDLPHGPVAIDVSAALGDPIPAASAEQLETFLRGQDLATLRFTPETGLGPSYNVTFCAACHERPVTGGSAGLYRNFFLAGTSLRDGSFISAAGITMPSNPTYA